VCSAWQLWPPRVTQLFIAVHAERDATPVQPTQLWFNSSPQLCLTAARLPVPARARMPLMHALVCRSLIDSRLARLPMTARALVCRSLCMALASRPRVRLPRMLEVTRDSFYTADQGRALVDTLSSNFDKVRGCEYNAPIMPVPGSVSNPAPPAAP
jgi:hypothetical protein